MLMNIILLLITYAYILFCTNTSTHLYSGTAATVVKTIICRPAVNADKRLSKNCRS